MTFCIVWGVKDLFCRVVVFRGLGGWGRVERGVLCFFEEIWF